MTRRRRRAVADRDAGRAGHRRRACCSPTRARSSPTRSRPTSAASRSGSTASRRSPGSFIGLVLGGVLAPIQWRLVFLVSVPIGLFGDRLGLPQARDLSERRAGAHRLVGQRHLRRRPDRGHGRHHLRDPALRAHTMGWTAPRVIAALIGGVALLAAFVVDRAARRRADVPPLAVPHPRVHRRQHRDLLAAIGRGGLQFILIIWLQGIWLPAARLRLHRDAAVGGHLHAAADRRLPRRRPDLRLPLRPLRRSAVRDRRHDRRRARASSCSSCCRSTSPTSPSRRSCCSTASAMGLFSSPNRAAIMNSLPADQRGAGAGMSATFQNAATVLSIGIFFSLMILGLAVEPARRAARRPRRPRRPGADATRVAAPAAGGHAVRRRSSATTRCSTCSARTSSRRLPHAQAAILTGRGFFPSLISGPFAQALNVAFTFALVACLIAAAASLLRGGRYHPRRPRRARGRGRRARPVRHRLGPAALMTRAARPPAALLVMDLQNAIVERFAD